MADDGRFFAETDPEWAISRLAAQAAASANQVEDKRSWRVIIGVLFTTGLVALAFLVGLTHDEPTPHQAAPATDVPPQAPTQQPTQQPSVEPLPVAPQATIAPARQSRPEPRPAVAPPPPEYVSPAVTAPAETKKPSKPSNQVGPNRPIKAPIDPDDR